MIRPAPWVGPAAAALVAAYVAVRPAEPHPPHGKHDQVAITTGDFLALSLVVVAVLRHFRYR